MADVLILAIETATGCGGVALTRGAGPAGRILAEYTLQPEITHSRRLLGSVAAILAATGIGWKELDGVAVSSGPGSFTGLRIGMAAAKGMAMAAGLPLLGVPTLDGLAAQVPPVDLPLCCVLDARKQQVYAALYRPEDGCYRRDSRFLVLRPEELAQHIHEPTLIVGPGLQACRTHLIAHPLARVTSAGFLHPRAAMIGFCGGQLLASGIRNGGGETVPLYVRASEAELNLRRMNGEMQGAL